MVKGTQNAITYFIICSILWLQCLQAVPAFCCDLLEFFNSHTEQPALLSTSCCEEIAADPQQKNCFLPNASAPDVNEILRSDEACECCIHSRPIESRIAVSTAPAHSIQKIQSSDVPSLPFPIDHHTAAAPPVLKPVSAAVFPHQLLQTVVLRI